MNPKKMKRVRKWGNKAIATALWVGFLWALAIGVLGYGNVRFFQVLSGNAPIWVWIVSAACLNFVFIWAIWDGLMSYTFDKFDMDERRD